MPTPGLITGTSFSLWARDTKPGADLTKLPALTLYKDTSEGAGTPESGLGVFGTHPGSTSKFSFNQKAKFRDAEYRETMARLYIELPNENARTAFLRSVSKDTEPLAKVLTTTRGTGGSSGTGFIDFLMTNASEPFQEKTQIVDTLTDNYVAFYSGREPPLFGYAGVLLNTYQDDQRVWMWRMYQEIMRGSRLATRNLLLRLRYDSFIVSGYMESLVLSLEGQTEHTASQFQFGIRVKRMSVITEALATPTIITDKVPDFTFSGDVNPKKRQAAVTSATPPRAKRKPAAQQLADLENAVAAKRRANAIAVLDRAITTTLHGPNYEADEQTPEARLATELETGNATPNSTSPPSEFAETPHIQTIMDGPT